MAEEAGCGKASAFTNPPSAPLRHSLKQPPLQSPALRTPERLGAKPQQRLSSTQASPEGSPLERLWGKAPNSGFHTPPIRAKAPLPSHVVPSGSRERALFWTPRSRPRRGGGFAPVTPRYSLKGALPWRLSLYFSSDGAAPSGSDSQRPNSGRGCPPLGVSLVLSFRPEKKEPRREGSKKTWRSASDGSLFSSSSLLSFSHPLLPPQPKEEGNTPRCSLPLPLPPSL